MVTAANNVKRTIAAMPLSLSSNLTKSTQKSIHAFTHTVALVATCLSSFYSLNITLYVKNYRVDPAHPSHARAERVNASRLRLAFNDVTATGSCRMGQARHPGTKGLAASSKRAVVPLDAACGRDSSEVSVFVITTETAFSSIMSTLLRVGVQQRNLTCLREEEGWCP